MLDLRECLKTRKWHERLPQYKDILESQGPPVPLDVNDCIFSLNSLENINDKKPKTKFVVY